MSGSVGALAAEAGAADTRVVRRNRRLAWLILLTLSVCIPEIAAACSIVPPPRPPPRTPAESDAEFAARRERWYADINERAMAEALPGRIAHEDRLWATARRVVLARVVRVRETRVRASEGQWYRSPLVTLRAIDWIRGRGSRWLRVHYLSADSCAFGGAGDAPHGEVGDVFLLFYGPGPLGPETILDTFRRDRAVTSRTQDAFRLAPDLENRPRAARVPHPDRLLRHAVPRPPASPGGK